MSTLILVTCGLPAHAVGGHFATDDAALLDPGHCQLETWAERERDGARRLFHAAPACRLGPVELGVGLDRVLEQGASTQTALGAQLKWAAALSDRVSAGVVAAALRESRSSRDSSATLYLPLSVELTKTLQAHANIGRDFTRGERDTTRAGVALGWQVTSDWLLVAERFKQSDAHVVRAGVRWEPAPSLAVDLSNARGLGATSANGWTLGVTWTFAPASGSGSAAYTPPGLR